MKSGSPNIGEQGEITATLYDGNGRSINLDQNDFCASSPVFHMGTSEGNTISIGSACIGEFDCNLNKDTVNPKISNAIGTNGTSWKWKGAYLKDVKVTCGSTFTFGTYYVNKHSESSGMITLTCYDEMELFEEHKISEDGIDWSQNSTKIIQNICGLRNVSYSTGNLTSYSLEEPDNIDNITERAFISYIAQMSGKFAIMRNGVLTFDWYSKSGGYDCGTVFSHELQCEDITIGGVDVTSNDGETEYATENTDKEYVVTITDNPFITGTNCQTVAQNIANSVNGIKFRPGNFSISSNPAIEAGDALLIDTSDDDNIFTLATTVQYKTTSATEQITADAKDESDDARMSADDYIKQYGGGGGCNHPDAEEVYW